MDDRIGPALRAQLDSLDVAEPLSVDIFLKKSTVEPDLDFNEDLTEAASDRSTRVSRIKATAAHSQADLLAFMQKYEGDFFTISNGVSAPKARVTKTFWITNSIAAEVYPEVLEAILQRDDVAHVELRSDAKLEDMLDGRTFPRQVEISQEKDPQPHDDGVTANPRTAEPTTTLKLINAPCLWKEGLRGDGVVVAVVDSGVNYDHPDLKDHMWNGGLDFPNHGFDFGDADLDPKDDNPAFGGHGTACAGVVAGNGASGTMTGVAPNATVMAIKINEPHTVWSGLEFAIDHGADVVSLSFSEKHAGPQHIRPEPDNFGWRIACESLLRAGVLHANSVGNNGGDNFFLPVPENIGPPGSCPPPRLHPLQAPRGGLSSAISCGATDEKDSLALDSGNGPVTWKEAPFADYPLDANGQNGLIKPDVCAPGVGIVTCNALFATAGVADPYVAFSGTSPAAAYIAGCLALLTQACKRYGQPVVSARIQEAVEKTATRIQGQATEKENNFGAGRVDVYEAFKYGRDLGWWG